MTSAAERLKAMFANAIERVCVLEEQLEKAQARIVELETAAPEPD
jgi:hypothetical protein